jgi:hypothetical protein
MHFLIAFFVSYKLTQWLLSGVFTSVKWVFYGARFVARRALSVLHRRPRRPR